MLGFAAFIDVDQTARTDHQIRVRLFQAQYVEDIAVRVQLRTHWAWQVQLPRQYVLTLAVMRRQAQVLNAGAHLVFIVVGGFMANRQSHTASR
ncbi:hypothetical protein D3C76_1458110 [compost metagenome]